MQFFVLSSVSIVFFHIYWYSQYKYVLFSFFQIFCTYKYNIVQLVVKHMYFALFFTSSLFHVYVIFIPCSVVYLPLKIFPWKYNIWRGLKVSACVMDSLVLHVPSSKLYWDGIFKLLRSPGIDSYESIPPAYVSWDDIFKLLRSPGIDSKESIPPAYVAWRAGTTTLFLHGSWHCTMLEFYNNLWGLGTY